MVASISARGGVEAALGYYAHLGHDDYFLRGDEPPGRWAGEGAARLSLSGPVIRSEFEAALNGVDPKTGERLVRSGGRSKSHAAGWDMTFSAPKSVSVLWALSDERDRSTIDRAQQTAVASATNHLERTAAWARRGKGGAVREPTAGLLIATFDHHTSRALDPQLHSHAFIFNLASRTDGTWGAILSRELYKAQKQAGIAYRTALAHELERAGYGIDRSRDTFRVAAIPREVERAFSKRRQAIEAAAKVHGYRTPKGMDQAALRTRQAKRDVRREALFEAWRAEARALGFVLDRDAARAPSRVVARSQTIQATDRETVQSTAAVSQLGRAVSKAATALKSLDQPAGMTGLAVDLRRREREFDRG